MTELDDICEFISRRGRVELLRIVVCHVGSVSRAAKVLGVSMRTVYRWLDPEDMHPSNESLGRILKTAMKLSSSETADVIRRELTLFSTFVDAEMKRISEQKM